MRERDVRRVSREIFLASFGVPVEDLEPWLLERFTVALREHFVRAGDVLYAPGRGLDSLYFMREGRVRVERSGAAPWTFEGRWLLGTFDLLRRGSLRRTATALEDFDALKIQTDAFLGLMRDSALLTRGALASAAATVAALERRLAPADVRTSHPTSPPPAPPLDAIGRLLLLKSLDAFREAGAQSLANLAAVSREVTAGAGASFPLEEPDRDELLFVIDGAVETSGPEERDERAFGPGDLLGGPAAIARKVHGWVGRAAAPTRLLAVPVDAWLDQIDDHFDLARATLTSLATRGDVVLEQLAQAASPEGIVLG